MYKEKRIVSLVPSLTELLYELELGNEIVGITLFCIHPKFNSHNSSQKPKKIGGTKNPDIEKILTLHPSVVIANKEENQKEDIDKLLSLGIDVLLTDIIDYNTDYEAILNIGRVFSKENKSLEIISKLQNIRSSFKESVKGTVLYLIWKDPYISIGNDTFIHYQLQFMGYESITTELKRYPEVDLHSLGNQKIDYIFLSSEPFPFKEKHIPEIQNQFPDSKIILVNGEFYSWYGVRQLHIPNDRLDSTL